MRNLEVRYLPVGDLLNDPRNARTHSQKQIRQVARSIERFGFNNPMLIDQARKVIAGHARLAAAKLLQLGEVPTIEIEHLTPAQRRAYMRALPRRRRWRELAGARCIGWGVLLANCLAQAVLTVGVLASLYAGYLIPEFRVTASQLSAVVNGFATILLFALIDPQISVVTDDAVNGQVSDPMFRRMIIWVSLSRLAGTLLAQVLLLPAASAISFIAGTV